jgi:hypothetical protein
MFSSTTKTALRVEGFLPNPKARLKDQFHEVARFKHLSPLTEGAYWGWVMRFLKFQRRGDQWRHPRELSPVEISAFLSHLATDRNVAAATQNQALNALIFLYREVLRLQTGEIMFVSGCISLHKHAACYLAASADVIKRNAHAATMVLPYVTVTLCFCRDCGLFLLRLP